MSCGEWKFGDILDEYVSLISCFQSRGPDLIQPAPNTQSSSLSHTHSFFILSISMRSTVKICSEAFTTCCHFTVYVYVYIFFALSSYFAKYLLLYGLLLLFSQDSLHPFFFQLGPFSFHSLSLGCRLSILATSARRIGTLPYQCSFVFLTLSLLGGMSVSILHMTMPCHVECGAWVSLPPRSPSLFFHPHPPSSSQKSSCCTSLRIRSSTLIFQRLSRYGIARRILRDT